MKKAKVGPPLGSQNAQKPPHLRRVQLSSARIPHWLLDQLREHSRQSGISMGQLVEDALIAHYDFSLGEIDQSDS